MTRVLLVDDEVFVRTSVVQGIPWAENGFAIECAGDGEQAYALLCDHPFDIMLTDIKMPKMDGLALLQKLEAENRLLEIIILSCYNEFELVRQAMVLGATDYLFKPTMYPKDILASVLKARERLEKRRATRAATDLLLDALAGKPPQAPDEQAWMRALEAELAQGRLLAVLRVSDDPAALLSRRETHAPSAAQALCTKLQEQLQTGRVAATAADEYIALIDGAALSASTLSELGARLEVRLYTGVSEELREGSQLREGYKAAALLARQAQLEGVPVKYADLAASRSDLIAETIVYMGEHLDDPSLSLQMLAERINLSKNYFAALLKERTGENFIPYLTRLRVRKARELYQNTDLKIYEIAAAVGYSDWHYLYQVYRKYEGHSLSREKRGHA
ncbi:MAG: response regulator [Candidatus Limiplasma sp.]|nr:response regulator [Candidatus Limiplasma sp.]